MSAWGSSWATSWGSSWGSVASMLGGIGHGGKKKVVYLERDGKILLFRNASHAAQYVAAEKKPDVAPQNVTKKVIHKPKDIQPTEVIDVEKLRQFYYGTPELQKIHHAIEIRAIEILISLNIGYHRAIQQEEDDLEVLLLAV